MRLPALRGARFGWVTTLVVGVLCLALGVGAGAWLRRGAQDTNPSVVPVTPVEPEAPTLTGPGQHTLLVQVRDDQGRAVDNALLGARPPAGPGLFMPVPAMLTMEVPDVGRAQLQDTIPAITAPMSSADVLQPLLGIRVDAALVMDRLAFEALVDGVGGVRVDATREIRRQPGAGDPPADEADAADPGADPILPGNQMLDGPAAATYVMTLMPGEPESDRMARFLAVLRQIVLRLPPDRDDVRNILGGLGSLARTNVPSDQVAAFLALLRIRLIVGNGVDLALPVVELPVDSASPLYRVAFDDWVSLRRAWFEGVLLVASPARPARVFLRLDAALDDGVVRPEVVTRLQEAGFAVIDGGTAVPGSPGSSELVIGVLPTEALVWASGVLASVGLTTAVLRVAEEGPVYGDLALTLGGDYVPL